MRRFSQRNALVTLSDINITPLLDLAFVLLIIFVIISPSIRSAHEQSIELRLPKGGQPETATVDPRDVMTIEISPKGTYALNGKLGSPLKQIETEIVRASQLNPKLIVWVRADAKSFIEYSTPIMDLCQEHGIKFSFKTEPKTK